MDLFKVDDQINYSLNSTFHTVSHMEKRVVLLLAGQIIERQRQLDSIVGKTNIIEAF